MGDSHLGSTVQQHDNRMLLPGTPSLRYSAVSVVASCECSALRCQEVNILLQVALPGEKAPDSTSTHNRFKMTREEVPTIRGCQHF